MKKVLILIIGAIIIFGGCGVKKEEHQKVLDENTKLKAEVSKLTGEVKTLKKQIDEIKFGADRLLSQAKNFYGQKEYSNAIGKLGQLIKRHPASAETAEGKPLLEKIKGIMASEKRKKELAEKRRLANATKKLMSTYDKIEKIRWYHDRATRNSYGSRMYLYLGKEKDSLPWLRFRLRYYGDSWLFIEKYIIQVDGKNYTYIPTETPKQEIASGGSVWETIDVSLDKNIKKIIKAVIKSKSAVIRFQGKNISDHTISSREKQGMKEIIDAYEALGGGKF